MASQFGASSSAIVATGQNFPGYRLARVLPHARIGPQSFTLAGDASR
ncbi:MAG: hypothetical protein HOV83_15190 [Catenulispora sp.]|nr:hypothetical protein [Catenulispora sp.]